MPRAVMRWGAMPLMVSPSNSTRPERGCSSPAMDLSRVDLPAPLAPATHTISPLAISIETSDSAISPLYAVVRLCSRSTAALPEIGADHVRIAHDIHRLAFGQH